MSVCKSKIIEIGNFFVDYFLKEGRSFSWRNNRTPFRVYLSEILLQRTRAEQAEQVFNSLVSRYSSIFQLYEDFQKVSQIMYPLGRFCRLQYFRSGLEYLIKNHGGEIPPEKASLMAVPGIGNYIAAAIRIFGYGIPDVIVDGNVVRVLCRLYGLPAGAETRRNKHFFELAEKHVPEVNYVDYSYGLLDFAAKICRPVRAGCISCHLSYLCNYVKESGRYKVQGRIKLSGCPE